MPDRNREVSPGPAPGTVTADHQTLTVPAGWVLLKPGDPGLTRRVKKAGPCWTMHEWRKRRKISLGLYAPKERIDALQRELETERADPAYEKKLVSAKQRRDREQAAYVEDFRGAIEAFLAFAPAHHELGRKLAQAIAEHATPVGSGTVARTKRISIERRAEAATIAWLRHATTGYDEMSIARIKGERREVRRMLAEQSRKLLALYRRGVAIEPHSCLLQRGLCGAGR